MRHRDSGMAGSAGALLIVALAFAGTANAAVEDVVRKSFNVQAGGRLNVDTDLGAIIVRTAPINRVDVEVYRKVDVSSREKAVRRLKDFALGFKQSGNDVTVTGEYQEPALGFWNWNTDMQVKFVITVPSRYNVDLRTSGGDVVVSDLQGEAKLGTSGGDLRIGRITGAVFGKTSGGDITVNGSTAKVEVKTSGGNIRILQASGDIHANTSGGNIEIQKASGRVNARTSGGDINVGDVRGPIEASTSGGNIYAKISSQPSADCRLSTSGGNVVVYLPKSARLNIAARTSGGSVVSEIPIAIHGKVDSDELNGQMNGGGPLLTLKTSAGNVSLKGFVAQ